MLKIVAEAPSLAIVACSGLTQPQPGCQDGKPGLAQLTPLERDRNLAVDVGRPLFQVGRSHIHDLLERKRVPAAACVDSENSHRPASTTLGNSWHGCRCSPTRIASLISATKVSGSCVHVRAFR
eukprot:7324646-Prymnesium_polylepis.2